MPGYPDARLVCELGEGRVFWITAFRYQALGRIFSGFFWLSTKKNPVEDGEVDGMITSWIYSSMAFCSSKALQRFQIHFTAPL